MENMLHVILHQMRTLAIYLYQKIPRNRGFKIQDFLKMYSPWVLHFEKILYFETSNSW